MTRQDKSAIYCGADLSTPAPAPRGNKLLAAPYSQRGAALAAALGDNPPHPLLSY
jgi:hypothetical protein